MFRDLKLYTVHVKPEDASALEKPVFVPEGFSFWAFLFSAFWMLYHRMWLAGVAVLLAEGLIARLESWPGLHPLSVAALILGFKLAVGYAAHDARRAQLARRGYIFQDIVASDNPLRARQRYFDRIMAPQH